MKWIGWRRNCCVSSLSAAVEVTMFVSYFAMVVTVTLAEKPVEECVELYLRVHVCASMYPVI